jgi:site-specific recombinase XerC
MSNVIALPGAAPAQPLLEQYAAYVAAVRSDSTAQTYVQAVRPFLAWLETQPGAGELHPVLVGEYLKHLARKQKGGGNATRRKALAAIRSYCRWLVGQGRLGADPTVGIEVPPPALATPRELSPFERTLAKICVTRAGTRRAAVIFWLAYGAGVRLAEVAALPRAHVDVGERVGRILIRGKGMKERAIKLTPETRKAVYAYLEESDERQPKDSPYLITPERQVGRQRIQPRAMEKAWENIKALANERDFKGQPDPEQAREQFLAIRYHDLRHDCAHRLREAGWNLEQIATYLGHQTRAGTPAIQTTVRYTAPTRAAMDRMVENVIE